MQLVQTSFVASVVAVLIAAIFWRSSGAFPSAKHSLPVVKDARFVVEPRQSCVDLSFVQVPEWIKCDNNFCKVVRDEAPNTTGHITVYETCDGVPMPRIITLQFSEVTTSDQTTHDDLSDGDSESFEFFWGDWCMDVSDENSAKMCSQQVPGFSLHICSLQEIQLQYRVLCAQGKEFTMYNGVIADTSELQHLPADVKFGISDTVDVFSKLVFKQTDNEAGDDQEIQHDPSAEQASTDKVPGSALIPISGSFNGVQKSVGVGKDAFGPVCVPFAGIDGWGYVCTTNAFDDSNKKALMPVRGLFNRVPKSVSVVQYAFSPLWLTSGEIDGFKSVSTAKAFDQSNKRGKMFFSFASVLEAPATFADEKHRAAGSTINGKPYSSRNKLEEQRKAHNASGGTSAGHNISAAHNASGGTNNTKTESYPWPLNYIFESDFAAGVAAMAGSFGKVLDTAFTSAKKIRISQVLATAFCVCGVCFMYTTLNTMESYQEQAWTIWTLLEAVLQDLVQNARTELVTQTASGFYAVASGFAETIMSTLTFP
jgi:hypothetical protein